MRLSVCLLDISSEQDRYAYDKFLHGVPNTLMQQTSIWCSVVKDLAPDEPYCVVVKDDDIIVGSLIVYLYRHEFGNILYSNPQAGSVGCLAVDPETDRKAVTALLLAAIEQIAADNDCLTITLTSNPFAEDNLLETEFATDYALNNRIHYIELSNFFDDNNNVTLRDYNRRSNLSRNLRKACEAGFQILESNAVEHLQQWYQLHEQRILELNGTPIPYKLFENALEIAVPRNQAAFLYIFEQEKIVGGGFHIYNHQIMDIFMMSTKAEAIQRGAHYFLIDHALKWARAKGIQYYNWQASNPPTGGIVRFKEQWGSKTANYKYYTRVLRDLDHLFETGLDTVRRAYLWHYVAPFGIFEQRDKREFSKLDSSTFLPFRN